MVHVVKQVRGGKTYISLQRSIYDKGKRRTEHVLYLGREDAYTKEELDRIIKKITKEVGKHENKRTKG